MTKIALVHLLFDQFLLDICCSWRQALWHQLSLVGKDASAATAATAAAAAATESTAATPLIVMTKRALVHLLFDQFLLDICCSWHHALWHQISLVGKGSISRNNNNNNEL